MQKALIIYIIILLAQFCPALAQDTDCCARRAVLKSCTINDPMGMMGSEPVGPIEEPIPPPDSGLIVYDWNSGTMLSPEESFCRSIKTRLAVNLSNDCFHIQDPEGMARNRQVAQRDGWSPQLKPSNPDEPEYSFDVEMVSGLDEYTDEGRPIRSSIKVELYFDGEQRELVHRWIAWGTWDTISNTGTSSLGLFHKIEASFREGPDIIEILESFEKRPVNCRVNPDKEELDAGEVIDIEIRDFKDTFGEKSREFNRLVVNTGSGHIMNGEPCEIGPDYRVFKVDNGSVKIIYKAPTNCNETEDRLTVYNSCEILPENRCPINETQIKERLTEKILKIKCYDASISITKRYTRTLETSDNDAKSGDSQKHTINESIEASAIIYLELIETQDMPIFNQTWQYYKPLNVNLGSFNYRSKENIHRSGPNYVTDVDYNRYANNYEIEGKESVSQFPWVLAIDNETGKAVKIVPAGYNIAYEINETETLNSVVQSSQGPKRESKTTSKTSEKWFELGPVGEEVPDPTIKQSDTWVQDYLKRQGVELPPGVPIPKISNEETVKKIQPDIIVSTGDGKYSFGGSGNRRIPKELVNGSQEENLYYRWDMTVKKKE